MGELLRLPYCALAAAVQVPSYICLCVRVCVCVRACVHMRAGDDRAGSIASERPSHAKRHTISPQQAPVPDIQQAGRRAHAALSIPGGACSNERADTQTGRGRAVAGGRAAWHDTAC